MSSRIKLLHLYDNTVKELKQLKELLDAKIINQEDFEDKKNAIMEKWQ